MARDSVSRRTFVAAAAAASIRSSALGFDASAIERRRATLCGIPFDRITHGASARSYLLIHGNERTAREVLLRHMETAQGKAHLAAGLERNVRVQGLTLDPNRMFSREGALKSFTRLNPRASATKINKALDWLDQRRGALLDALLPPPGGLLVALHNNSEGYSLEDEVGLSDSVSLPWRAGPNEFMLATTQGDFDALAQSPFNVVLQKTVVPDDDGSLSRLCTARGVRYVNIEAYIGRAAEQTAMLAWLEENLA